MTRLLVIDDEPDVRDVLSQVLERAGYEVTVATTAHTGLAQCREARPAVVITDIIMPGGHGVDLIRTLRSEFPQIGIIAMSGGGNAAIAGYQPGTIATAAYMAAAEQAGANFCLTKPFERAELLDRIVELVSAPQSR